MRILSLLPAGTEIVCALGAGDSLVGISHECDYPRDVTRDLPRVTTSLVASDASSLDIDTAVRRLVANKTPVFALSASQITHLQPTVILTQSLCDVCAISDGVAYELATLLSPAPVILPLVGRTIATVWDDIRAIGKTIAREGQADELIASLDARMRRVHETLKAARAPRPRVAVIEWLDPLFVAGHWTPELVRRAGGIDVLAEPGSHSAQVNVSEIRDASPELLLFAPCGFDVHRAEREARALLNTGEWSWASDHRAWALDGNALTSRPGPRLVDAMETIAAIVAPSLFEPPSPAYAAILR